jgi:hypothetical protein
MRMMVSAPAIRDRVTHAAIASRATATAGRPFPDFALNIALDPLDDFGDYFLCNLMQRLCQWEQ